MNAGVPPRALHGLLTLLTAQGLDEEVMRWLMPLLHPRFAATQMRRFKLDVSVDLSPMAAPRMSLNDTGEPQEFRRRLRVAAPRLGLDPAWLDDLFAISSPGDGQTTIGLKWRREGLCTTLYFEELPLHSDPGGCRAAVREHFGLTESGPDGPGRLGAVGIDLVAGRPVALKEYRMVELGSHTRLLPPTLSTLAKHVPVHPRTGLRRAIIADRIDRKGEIIGRKLLWMTEARSASEAQTVWRQAFQLVRTARVPVGPNLGRLTALLQGWRWRKSCFVYPDLVSLDVDEAGRPMRAILYVSAK